MTAKNRIDRLKEDKRKNAEVIEEVLAAGDSSDVEGNKVVAQIEKANIKKENEAIGEQIQKSTDKRKWDDLGYLKQVREAANDYLITLDPADYPGWQVKVFVTNGEIVRINKSMFKSERGLLGVIISPEGQVYYRAIRMSFDPYVDTLAARQLAISIEDSLDTYFEGRKLIKPNFKI